MWYSFWDAEKDDNVAFERRVDQVLREVGERGRPIVAESVPPQTRAKRPVGPSVTAPAQSSPPAPGPAPAPAPAPAIARNPEPSRAQLATASPVDSEPKALAAGTTPQTTTSTGAEQTFTSPTVPHRHEMASSEAAQVYGEAGRRGIAGSSLTEMTSFMKELQRMQMERDAETKGERAEMDARLEAKLEEFRRDAERQRQQFEDLRLEAERAKHQEELERIESNAVLKAKHQEELERQKAKYPEELQRIKSNAVQVPMLQSRLEALHNAKLLTVRDCYQSTPHWLF